MSVLGVYHIVSTKAIFTIEKKKQQKIGKNYGARYYKIVQNCSRLSISLFFFIVMVFCSHRSYPLWKPIHIRIERGSRIIGQRFRQGKQEREITLDLSWFGVNAISWSMIDVHSTRAWICIRSTNSNIWQRQGTISVCQNIHKNINLLTNTTVTQNQIKYV